MAERVIHDTEVVVIGAGAVGVSIAYHLRERNVDVTLIDAHAIGGGTSSATFGLIWVQTKIPDHYTRFSLLSSDLWPRVAEALDEDVEYRRDGGLRLAFSEEEMEALKTFAAERAGVPELDLRVIDGDEVRRLEPAVSPEVVGGLFCSQDGHVNAIAYVNVLARLAQRRGVRIMAHAPCRDILRDSHGAVAGVKVPEGVIRCRTVVNAAGVHVATIARMVGVTLPVVPCRGEILVSEPLPPIISRPINLVVRQSPKTGVLFMGESSEFVGLNRGNTLRVFKRYASAAVRAVPALGNVQGLRMFAGLRPWPPDGLPLIGEVKRVPGFYVATGHSGITLSPAYGKVISDLIVDGHTDVPIDRYDPCRWEGQEVIEFTRHGTTVRVDMRHWPNDALQPQIVSASAEKRSTA